MREIQGRYKGEVAGDALLLALQVGGLGVGLGLEVGLGIGVGVWIGLGIKGRSKGDMAACSWCLRRMSTRGDTAEIKGRSKGDI